MSVPSHYLQIQDLWGRLWWALRWGQFGCLNATPSIMRNVRSSRQPHRMSRRRWWHPARPLRQREGQQPSRCGPGNRVLPDVWLREHRPANHRLQKNLRDSVDARKLRGRRVEYLASCRDRVQQSDGAYIRTDKDGTLELEFGCETSEPFLEL